MIIPTWLTKKYPLFKFDINGELIRVTIKDGVTTHIKLVNENVDHQSELYLNQQHMQRSMCEYLMSIYPDLFISVYARKEGCLAFVWVKRDGRDWESIHNELNILSQDFHQKLEQYQTQAQQAKQDGWFFCSGHSKAEPKTEYGYYHFAGNYCKQYGIEHPESLRRAQEETYN